MKFFLPYLAIALLAFSASAQIITVEVKLDQDQFLPGETLPVTVRVVNNSGQTLHLGADASWLQFNIISVDNNSGVLKTAEPPVIEPFDLESSHVATKRLDLEPYYRLKHAGRYRIV